MLREDMRLSEYLLYALLSIVLALLLSSIFIIAIGQNPIEAFICMFREAFFTKYGLCEIVVRSTPLILIGMGIAICYKAGIMNLGGDGQLYLGAIASTMVGISLEGRVPTPLLFLLILLSAMLVGGLWGGLAGYFKARFNTNEIIVTLMMNFLALYFFRYLVEGPCMDPDVYLAQTAQVPESLRFARFIHGLRINSSLVIIVIVVLIAWFVVNKTIWGYNIELLGNSPSASQYAGVNKRNYFVALLFISGALSGLAGCIEVYAIHYRALEGLTADFGFVAVIIALLANKDPIGVVIAGIFISGLQVGANAMQVDMGIPSSIVSMTQSIIILLLMVVPAVIHTLKVKKAERQFKLNLGVGDA